MNIECEVKFYPLEKEQIRKKLKKINASLKNKEVKHRRKIYHLPESNTLKEGVSFLRVRDEVKKVTMSLKKVNYEDISINNVSEIMLNVDNFENACEMIEKMGCKKKSYQENYREDWSFENVEISIITWPFLKPFIEIEGPNESEVKRLSNMLGFDYKYAIFGTLDAISKIEYPEIDADFINHIPVITFEVENPFFKEMKRLKSI